MTGRIILILVAVLIIVRILLKRTALLGSMKGRTSRKPTTAAPKHRQAYTILTFAKISVRRYFRDRVAIFFTVAFPLIFLFVFGLTSKNNDVTFHIGLINQSQSQFSQKFVQQIKSSKTYKVDESVTDLAQAQTKMGRSEIDATLVLPPGFGDIKNGVPSGQAVIYYDENNAQAAQTMQAVLQE